MRITGELFLLDTSSWGATKKHSASRMWPAGRSLPTPALGDISSKWYREIHSMKFGDDSAHILLIN